MPPESGGNKASRGTGRIRKAPHGGARFSAKYPISSPPGSSSHSKQKSSVAALKAKSRAAKQAKSCLPCYRRTAIARAVPSSRPRAFGIRVSLAAVRRPCQVQSERKRKTPPERLSSGGVQSLGPDSLPSEGSSVSDARADAWRDDAKVECAQSIFGSSVHASLWFLVDAELLPRPRDAASTPLDSSSQARLNSFFARATRCTDLMVIDPFRADHHGMLHVKHIVQGMRSPVNISAPTPAFSAPSTAQASGLA